MKKEGKVSGRDEEVGELKEGGMGGCLNIRCLDSDSDSILTNNLR